MQIDELFLLMLYALHVLVVAVSHFCSCGEVNVTYVPKDMKSVSSTIGVRRVTSLGDGLSHCTGARAIDISLRVSMPAGATRILIKCFGGRAMFPVLENSAERGCIDFTRKT